MSSRAATADLLATDAWLGRTLGTPAFTLRLPLPPAAVVAGELARLPDPAFCFAKVPAADVASVAALENTGFRLVDTQVTLERGAEPAPAAPRVEVRLAEPRDRDAVLNVAGSSFRFSRFHQDPRIGLKAAHAVKRAWAASCLDGQRGEEVLVALDQGQPAGFLAVLLAQDAAVIDLIAVAAQSQRRGIGGALVDAFIGRWRTRAARLRVGTQQANTASLRLYEGCGFRAVGTTRVLHAHWCDGRVQ
jgi:ribosomal protein S18 acetylase RimI-like enzyme